MRCALAMGSYSLEGALCPSLVFVPLGKSSMRSLASQLTLGGSLAPLEPWPGGALSKAECRVGECGWAESYVLKQRSSSIRMLGKKDQLCACRNRAEHDFRSSASGPGESFSLKRSLPVGSSVRESQSASGLRFKPEPEAGAERGRHRLMTTMRLNNNYNTSINLTPRPPLSKKRSYHNPLSKNESFWLSKKICIFCWVPKSACHYYDSELFRRKQSY
jgi:hypothetical protein